MTKPSEEKKERKLAKGLREPFSQFFEQPTRARLAALLKADGGEFRELEFKQRWPEKAALAKQVLAMANAGGGVIIAGVREEQAGQLVADGLEALTDKAVVYGGIKAFLPAPLLDQIAIYDFRFDESDSEGVRGKVFQALFVEPDLQHRPFIAVKDGQDLRQGAIYVRREGMADLARYEEVQRFINERIGTGYSTQGELDLRAHLDQLKVLYGEIQRTKVGAPRFLSALDVPSIVEALGSRSQPNPAYPAEDFESFIVRLIERKKWRIEHLLQTGQMR